MRIGLLIFQLWIFSALAFTEASKVNVLTYSSMLDKGGLGEFIVEHAKKNGLSINFHTSKDFAGILGQLRKLKREAKLSEIDVVLGLNRTHYESALQENLISAGEKFEEASFSFLVNKELLKEKDFPKNWEELKRVLKDKILVQDPRTSEPGMAWLLNENLNLNEKKELPLRVFPSWSSSFEAFEKGMAPALWTYATSAAYFACNEVEKIKKYANLPLPSYPKDTNYVAATVPSNINPDTKKTMALLLSKEVQQEIWTRNWMRPGQAEELKLKAPLCYEKIWSPEGTKQIPALSTKEILNKLDQWSL